MQAGLLDLFDEIIGADHPVSLEAKGVKADTLESLGWGGRSPDDLKAQPLLLLVDDDEKNLKPATEKGIATVLVQASQGLQMEDTQKIEAWLMPRVTRKKQAGGFCDSC